MSVILTRIPASWSMYVNWQLGAVAWGLNPATNPKFGFPPAMSMKPPPVTKSFGLGYARPHRMSLCAWETMTCSPVTRVRSRAFTGMSNVPSRDPSVCSLMTRVSTPGTFTTWFGAVPTTIALPPIARLAISLTPETQLQVAVDWARTKSAVISLAVPGTRCTEATAASLWATSSNPIVTATRTSAAASDVSTWTTVASIVPPPGGRSPVSANAVSKKAVWMNTPVALPLNWVSVSHADATGAVEISPAQIATTASNEARVPGAGEFMGDMVCRTAEVAWSFPNIGRTS